MKWFFFIFFKKIAKNKENLCNGNLRMGLLCIKHLRIRKSVGEFVLRLILGFILYIFYNGFTIELKKWFGCQNVLFRQEIDDTRINHIRKESVSTSLHFFVSTFQNFDIKLFQEPKLVQISQKRIERHFQELPAALNSKISIWFSFFWMDLLCDLPYFWCTTHHFKFDTNHFFQKLEFQ